MEGESNVLLDGSLIDLCGAVLLWRSAEALKEMEVCCLFYVVVSCNTSTSFIDLVQTFLF